MGKGLDAGVGLPVQTLLSNPRVHCSLHPSLSLSPSLHPPPDIF